MNCPKCNKDTAVLITTTASNTTQERKGIILWILLFPFMFIYWLFRVCFGRRQTYYKKTHYRCNYCGHDFPAEFKELSENQDKKKRA